MKSNITKHKRINIITVAVFLVLAILIRLAYLNYTNYNQRGYDADDHLAYIEFVANKLHLPAPDQGWEYHQAPLYYITAAIIYKIFPTNIKSLQVLSLFYSTISLIFGVILLRLLFNKSALFYSASLLFLMWPTGIIHSVRIGNDPMYYMMSIISIYFLVTWLSFQRKRDFYLTAIFTSLTIAVKLNGIIILAIVTMLLIYQYLKHRKAKDYIKPALFLIIVALLSITLSFSRNIKAASSLKNFNLINGNTTASMNRALAVKNTFTNYITFDEKLFMTQTFTSPWEDKKGREDFWNYLLKTMLFGEFSYDYSFNPKSATIINITTTEMIVFFVIGVIYTLRKLTSLKLVMFLQLFFSLASLIYYRYSFPFSSNEDFRFIFPAVIPCIYFYFSGIEYLTKKKIKILVSLGYALTYIFILSSCIFFLSPLSP